MLNGVDLSIDQGTIDFHALASEVGFVFAKATEGITYSDARFREYHDQAKAANIPFGAYHFFHGGDNGAAQAAHFLSAIDGYGGDLVPMVDCEAGGLDGVSPGTFLSRLGMFLSNVDATLRGKRAIIYFGYSFWVNTLGGYDGFCGHPAWPAAYNPDASLDMTGTGWSDWTLWQYSDGSGLPYLPGMTTPVDRDRLRDLALIRR